MSGRIYYDNRTGKYHGHVNVQDGTESIGEHGNEGDAQLAWIQAMWVLNHTLPFAAAKRAPAVENVTTPSPMAKFTDEEVEAEFRSRKTRVDGRPPQPDPKTDPMGFARWCNEFQR